MTDVSKTLNARNERYGSFSGQAGITQALKEYMRHTPNWNKLEPEIARILNGDPRYADSWHDIAGYATLVDKRLNGDSV